MEIGRERRSTLVQVHAALAAVATQRDAWKAVSWNMRRFFGESNLVHAGSAWVASWTAAAHIREGIRVI
jgi:uncharacterized protein YdhG (YjbR/CyaY superfamily)